MAKAPKEETVPSDEGTKTSYEKWVQSEGIPVIKTFFVEDIRTVKLVRRLFEEALARHGIKGQMEKYHQKNP